MLVESELWPNLILAAKARGGRIALVSARLSPASLARWCRAPASARHILSRFDLILARDAPAADGLESLGARVAGLADLKFGAHPLPAAPSELASLGAALAGRTVLFAASTHPGEEAILLDAFGAARGGGASSVLIIAPRHPERGAEIESLARARGWRAGRRDAHATLAELDIYIADTLGEVGLFYRLARLSVIGGSLVENGAGGHNPLEPARLGAPFVAGRDRRAWPVYDDLVRAGGTRLVDEGDLTEVMRRAIADPSVFGDMGERARVFVEAGDAEAAGAIIPVLDLLKR